MADRDITVPLVTMSVSKKTLFLSILLLTWLDHSAPALSMGSGEDMILISEGKFLMGMKDGDSLGLVWATPQRNIDIPVFYIDKYEVTNEKYKAFADATGRNLPFQKKYDTIYNWKKGRYSDNLGNHPVVLVDWYDAEAYCRWLKKRLPSEAEWEKAARGTDGRKWPWGSKFNKFSSNTIEFGLEMTMPVGIFPGGASPYGVMDMAGNVSEWTSGWYRGYSGTKYQRPDYGKKYKVARGGAWSSPANPYALPFSRSPHVQTYKHRTLGFRCAKSVRAPQL